MEFTKEQIETRKKEILERLEELKSYLGQELYNEFLEDITDEYVIKVLQHEHSEINDTEPSIHFIESEADIENILNDIDRGEYNPTEDIIFSLSEDEYNRYLKKTCGHNGRTIIHE